MCSVGNAFFFEIRNLRVKTRGPAMAIQQKKSFKALGIREVRKGESESTHVKMLNFARGRINEDQKAQFEALTEMCRL